MCYKPGTVTLSRRSGEAMEFEIRRCVDTDLYDIVRLQKKIYEGLNDPGLYALVDEEDILESLKLDYCYGTYHDGELVAFTMMIGNRVSMRNYGNYVGYPTERQKGCVSLEITFVDEMARGFGLQRYFVHMREGEAKRIGAREALVTIAPDNKHSLQNFLNEGYEIIATKPLYAGAVRHILSKQLLPLDSTEERQ